MAKPTPPKTSTPPKAPADAPQAPEGNEKFLDKMGRYSLYGQMFGNDSANMTMGQRIGGAAFSAFEQATLGQMGTLGKAMSAGLSARGKANKTGGTGVDTQEIQFQQIKGDDVVSAINQSTGQLIKGLNSVNTTLGRGFNGLKDELQSHSQKLDSIAGYGEDTAIGVRELYEQLNKLAYDRNGKGNGSTAIPVGAAGATPGGGSGGSSGGGLLGDLLSGAAFAGGGKLLEKMLGKGAGKTVLKSIVKKIPVLGLLFGLGFAASRLAEGDVLGAAGEVLSGAASLIPGAGTAASVGIDAGLAARDLSQLGEEDAVEQETQAPTPALENEKEQYAYINDPGIEGQQGDLGKPGPNHGVRVKLIKKVPSGWIVEYPNGYQAFTGEKTILKDPPKVDQLPSTGPQSSLDIRKNIQVASITPTTMTDASPAKAEPWPENWDEEFYKKFPDWMNAKDLDYPPSRLMDSPTGLQGPDTSEQKLKEQERISEEAQKEQIVSDVLINAKELFYKAENITFDADKIVFKYNQLGEQAGNDATSTDTGGISPPPAGTQVTESTGAGGAGGVASGFARGGQDVVPGDVTGAGVVPQAPSSVTDVIKSAPTPGAGPAQMGTAVGSIPQGGFGPAVKDGSNGKLPDSQLAPIGIGSLKAQPSAAAAFKAMRAAASAEGVKLGATDGYRTFAQQVDVKRRKPNLAATPGRSNHGWGLAFDMDFGSNVNSPGYKWMVANAARFGFKGPLKKPNEPWHWEYAGGGGGAPAPDATQVASQPGGAGEGAPVSTGGGGGGVAPSPTASPMGAGGAPSPMPGGGGAGNPLTSMLGGGGSPFGMASAMLGPVIGSMSKNASLNAAAPQASAPTTNIYNNAKQSQGMQGQGGINPGQPQPAVSSMFAKLFEGSAMFG